mmetsp:Transcript_18939/g.27669  ORF Transcript_18939/g.27669 Transcript_18939/m.27669 type:complete len:273 (-) Transcript_18939:316-1134(-)
MAHRSSINCNLLPVCHQFLIITQACIQRSPNLLLTNIHSNEHNLLTTVTKFLRYEIFCKNTVVFLLVCWEIFLHVRLADGSPPLTSGGNTKVLPRVTPEHGSTMPPIISIGTSPLVRCHPTVSLGSQHTEKGRLLIFAIYFDSFLDCLGELTEIKLLFDRYWPVIQNVQQTIRIEGTIGLVYEVGDAESISCRRLMVMGVVMTVGGIRASRRSAIIVMFMRTVVTVGGIRAGRRSAIISVIIMVMTVALRCVGTRRIRFAFVTMVMRMRMIM